MQVPSLTLGLACSLLAGGQDQLAAFTAAKKALRSKYPDPFHWAPFLYVGSPE
jgi:CHAT domain-containing protein